MVSLPMSLRRMGPGVGHTRVVSATNCSALCQTFHLVLLLFCGRKVVGKCVRQAQMLREKRLRNDKEVSNCWQHGRDARELGMEMNAGDPRTWGAEAGES